MIKLRHFRKIDLLAVLILALLWSGVAYLVTFYLPYIFEIILFTTALFATFTVLLIRKIGSVTLFFSLSGVMTSVVPVLGFLGFGKILVFVLMGVVFEMFVYVFKKYLNLVVASSVSNGSMPWFLAVFGGRDLSANLSYALWNFTIISSLLGFLGSLTALVVWYKVGNSKVILKFEYE